MKQDALVISGGKIARVLVMRSSACTGECESCGGCETARPVYAEAYNAINALPGAEVIVETETKEVMTTVLVIYALPLLLFFVLYFLTQSWGVGNTWSVVCGLSGFVMAFLIARHYNASRVKKPACTIVEFRETGSLKE